MKKKLFLAAFMLTAATSFAVRGDLGPAITGTIDNGSWVEVRVTANVVDGIAVNEASPIDFGNLVRDNGGQQGNGHVYLEKEKINAIKPGVVTYRAAVNNGSYTSFSTYIETNTIKLENIDGVAEGDSNKYINNVTISGITDDDSNGGEDIQLNKDGTARKELRAHFFAYENEKSETNYENGNLGSKQMLGNYEGKVRVYAIANTNN